MINDYTTLKTGRVEFIFIAVQATDVHTLVSRIGKVMDAASQARWMVLTILGNVVALASGLDVMTAWKTRPREEIISTVQSLTDQTSKVLFGEAEMPYGNLGSPTRLSYGVLFTHTPEMLSMLCDISPGAAQEYKRGV